VKTISSNPNSVAFTSTTTTIISQIFSVLGGCVMLTEPTCITIENSKLRIRLYIADGVMSLYNRVTEKQVSINGDVWFSMGKPSEVTAITREICIIMGGIK
jgi:hypothetical protein